VPRINDALDVTEYFWKPDYAPVLRAGDPIQLNVTVYGTQTTPTVTVFNGSPMTARPGFGYPAFVFDYVIKTGDLGSIVATITASNFLGTISWNRTFPSRVSVGMASPECALGCSAEKACLRSLLGKCSPSTNAACARFHDDMRVYSRLGVLVALMHTETRVPTIVAESASFASSPLPVNGVLGVNSVVHLTINIRDMQIVNISNVPFVDVPGLRPLDPSITPNATLFGRTAFIQSPPPDPALRTPSVTLFKRATKDPSSSVSRQRTLPDWPCKRFHIPV